VADPPITTGMGDYATSLHGARWEGYGGDHDDRVVAFRKGVVALSPTRPRWLARPAAGIFRYGNSASRPTTPTGLPSRPASVIHPLRQLPLFLQLRPDLE
jgi:hypothetical protein